MTEQKMNRMDLTDASLQYYHKNTLKYLLKLDVVRYQEKPNDALCTVEQTPHFRTVIKKTEKETDGKKQLYEDIFQDLARTKGIKLRKNLIDDMMKLMSLEWGETSLSYYPKDALKWLLELNVITYLEKTNDLSYALEQTPYFTKLMEDSERKNSNKMSIFEHIFLTLERKKGIHLSKKIRYDMIKLMGFIEKFGDTGKIWIE